ncbi:hypothetical protein tloyanaT_07470 [Thalassotalea loyana]|uniref:Uncharacterized protein n=1 Tax=Thalassotalea loyana TaxID=280483 RepID=A0ABQ6H8P9_9GAMM|nr:hypothetical protein [Thalassotalea loyana]GLX84495.1 hypothetical protein tloyanaT_07470 [Thalassotalea loyana]
MNLKHKKSGFVAGMMVCFALLLNDLIIFGNLNLNTASIVFLSAVGLLYFVGYVIAHKQGKAELKQREISNYE